MENSTRGGHRKGSGRKTLDGKPANTGNRSERIHVTLSASQMAWVKAQDCNISDYIRRIIEKDMESWKA